MVYRLAGHGWSMAQSVSGKPVTYELARDVSRELGGRAMWLAVSDTASWTGYLLFNAGVLVEILEDYVDHHNNASHLPPDLVRSLTVQSTGHGIFGSSWRKVPLSKLKTPKDVDKLIDDLLRAENTLAPVSGEWNDEGGLVTLDLPYLSEEDVERLDFLGNGEVPPPTAAEQKVAAELERFRRLMGNRKPR